MKAAKAQISNDELDANILKVFCSDSLNCLKNVMQNQYDFDCDYYLIGSGTKNLVTKNENKPFDLDYNFEIKSFPNNFNPNNSDKLKQSKDLIGKELNKIPIISHI